VSKQKLNLFDFAAAIVAESGTGPTNIVARQTVYAGLSEAPLHPIPGMKITAEIAQG
jgi:hypothetical protein